MENDIFDLGLSVEAVSLYILLDYLGEFMEEINLDAVRPKWSSTEEMLDRSLEELHLQGVISRQGLSAIRLAPCVQWKKAREA